MFFQLKGWHKQFLIIKEDKMEENKPKIQLIPGAVYTEKEVSTILSLTNRTLRKYRRNGMIKKSGCGGKINYTYDNIMAYLKAEKPPGYIKRLLDSNGESENKGD